MNKLTEVSIIVVGGAAGGLLSVLDSWGDPVSYPLTLSKLASLLLIPGLKGGAAAGIGVYLLTTLDSAQIIRAFFFSVTCGLAFPSILSSSAGYAQKVTNEVANKSIATNTEKLKMAAAPIATSAASAPALSASAVEDIREASIAILQAAPKVKEQEAKAADAFVQQAVSDLAKAANANTSALTVDTIADIGVIATAKNSIGASEAAVDELKLLQSAPKSSPDVQKRATIGLERLERARSPAR